VFLVMANLIIRTKPTMDLFAYYLAETIISTATNDGEGFVQREGYHHIENLENGVISDRNTMSVLVYNNQISTP